jgi:sodium transport system permease protein
LKRAGLPATLPNPVDAEEIDVAKQEQIAANVWSKMFPALVVIMAVTGAFYPAVDLGAGEKERGTMETLLICPARRSEIVVGKFLTIMLFSVATALLNLMSMGFTGRYMVSVVGNEGLSRVGDLSLPGPLALTWVIVLLLPLAALFSATSLALATFARSSKEGQYYLTPLLMVTMGLTVFCMFPTVEIEPFYSVMPVVGPALLLKELLSSPGSTRRWSTPFPCSRQASATVCWPSGGRSTSSRARMCYFEKPNASTCGCGSGICCAIKSRRPALPKPACVL